MASLLLLLCAQSGCTRGVYTAEFSDPAAVSHKPTARTRATLHRRAEALDTSAPFLKCHFHDGRVVVLSNWRLGDREEYVEGNGRIYSAERRLERAGRLRVRLADVALLETNRPEEFARTGVAVMAVLSGVSAALTAYCIVNPKACFGSCPTFYAFDGERFSLAAEGFSSSIARVREQTDVDALFDARDEQGRLRLWLTNEAPETHVLRRLHVLAAERPTGGRVYRAGQEFVAAGPPLLPQACTALGQSCLGAVRELDGVEWLAPTDGVDLANQATLELQFEGLPEGELGLVVAKRDGLLGSYLFYQALAHAGDRLGELMAELERGGGPLPRALDRVDELLGDVAVQVRGKDGVLRQVGTLGERGPIARELELVRLPRVPAGSSLSVRLVGTRGQHKIDFAALVPIHGPASVERLEVIAARDEHGPAPEALQRLRDPERSLVTQPGEAYLLEFAGPECEDCELFLETRGYYYEWGRTVWHEERDDAALVKWITQPRAMLRALAPDYAAIEPKIEQLFFESRVKTRMQPPELLP